MKYMISLITLLFLALPVHSNPAPEVVDALPQIVEMRDGLAIPRMRRGGRTVFLQDAIVNDLPFKTPQEGDSVTNAKGDSYKWTAMKADENGWISGEELYAGYLYWSFQSASERVMVLEADGHSAVRVNGNWRAGDPYRAGHANIAVQVKQGLNEFLFGSGRGTIKARLVKSTQPVFVHMEDKTLPHIIRGVSQQSHFAAIRIMNTSPESVSVGIRQVGGAVYKSYPIAQMSVRKIPFQFGLNSAVEGKQLTLPFELINNSEVVQGFDLDFSTADKTQKHKITFLSDIDGSIQYYGLTPATPLPGQTDSPGIVLALHGASVEGIGHARAYGHKTWCHIVAPTNRRPYGFDWEDWGRIDALEVLTHAKQSLSHDPSKVYLTGHSMGGHGTWTLGAQYPDKFCALGPCAAWQTFWTYGGGSKYDLGKKDMDVLQSCSNIHRHELLMQNYAEQAIFVLHGDADKTVPVKEARRMRKELSKFHKDLHWFEEQGRGHWYDTDKAPGANCVDYAPMFELFAKRRLPQSHEVKRIDFTTVWPGVSAKNHWATIAQQEQQLSPSRIQLRAITEMAEITGLVENVSLLELDVSKCLRKADTISFVINGFQKTIEWPDSKTVLFRIEETGISLANSSSTTKNPDRCGMFKSVFDRNAVLVYGTQGSKVLQQWAFNKARYDSEAMLVRGNASFEVVSDTEYLAGSYKGRNVVLYGNKDCNSCWAELLGECPVQVQENRITAEGAVYDGSAAVLLVYPGAENHKQLIGAVAPTDITAGKVLDRQNYFVSGVAFPDVLILSSETLRNGSLGLIGAAMFDNNWQLNNAESLVKNTK